MTNNETEPITRRAQHESRAELSRGQLTFAVAGVVLPLLALNMVEGSAIGAVPRAVAALNGFDRYAWPSTSFLLTSTISMPVFAKLSDLYGRKWFYLFGAAMAVAYALLCGAAGALPIPLDGMNQVVLASGILGLGHGAIMVLSFTIVADLFPPRERGRYQGLLAAVSILPFTIGPSLGGWITDHFSWRWAWYANVPLGVVAILAVAFLIPDLRGQRARRRIDWAGIVTLCAWIAPLLLALTWAGGGDGSAPLIRTLLISSAVMLIVFLLAERRAAEPLLILSLFRDSRISMSSASIFLMGIGIYGVAVYLPVLLQGVLGASATGTGIIFGEYVLATVAGNVIGGQLLSRSGWYRFLTIGGSGLTAAGLFLISRMDGRTTQPAVLFSLILCGIGFGVLTPTYEVLIQNAAPAGTMGVATGVTQFFRSVGGSIGLAIFGAMLLRIYHTHIDHLLPQGAPAALKQAFDDPLQLVFKPPNLSIADSGPTNAGDLLRTLLDGSRAGLTSAMQSVFAVNAAALAVSCVLNALAGGARPQVGNAGGGAV
jgi:EmrB/QacA subfamily drug resistance transporter